MPAKPPPKPAAGTKSKEAAKAAKQEARAASKLRRAQVLEAFNIQRREDKVLLPLMIGVFLGITAVVFGVGFLFGQQWISLPLGVTLGGSARY